MYYDDWFQHNVNNEDNDQLKQTLHIPLSRLAHQAVLVMMYPSIAPQLPPRPEPATRFSLDACTLPYGGRAIGILHTVTSMHAYDIHWTPAIVKYSKIYN